jgi:putative sigma-54 modulation protein
MRCDIRSGHVNLKSTLRDYIEQRLDRSLGRMQDRISHVMIRVDDVHGPRGGADKRCHAEAHLVRSGLVLADVIAGDIRTAVDEAADRLALRIRKQIGRQRDVRRHPHYKTQTLQPAEAVTA